MQDPVKLLKTKSLPDFLISLNIPLVNTGKNYSTCCPFHSEKTPSFSISPETNRWKCFGSCGINGDIIEFVQRYKNFTFPQALDFLCEHYKIERKNKNLNLGKSERFQILEINSFVAEFYEECLNNSLGILAIDYLKERKQSLVICKEFSIGYAPSHSEVGWNFLYSALIEKNFNISICEKIGLIKKSKIGNYYDCFRGRIIFPIYNLQNECIGFNSRILPLFEFENNGNIKNDQYRVPKYLLSKETEVFNRKKIIYGYNKSKKIIDKKNIVCLVEGIFDFLRMYSFGVKNCIPLLGGEFLKENCNVENYYLLMDNDAAGISYNNKIGSDLFKEGKHVRICSLLKDPDDCTKKEIGNSLKQSENYFNWIINQLFKYHDSIEHKIDVLNKLKTLINGMPEINLLLYCNEIVNKLNLPIDFVIPFMTLGEVKYKNIIDAFRQSNKT